MIFEFICGLYLLIEFLTFRLQHLLLHKFPWMVYAKAGVALGLISICFVYFGTPVTFGLKAWWAIPVLAALPYFFRNNTSFTYAYLALCVIEEFACRYMLLNVSTNVPSAVSMLTSNPNLQHWNIVLWTSLQFGAAHLYHEKMSLTVGATVFSFLCGVYYIYTESIFGCVALHYIIGTMFTEVY